MTKQTGIDELNEFIRHDIFAGALQRVTEPVEITGDADLPRGAVLTKDGEKYRLINSNTEEIYGILACDVEAGGAGVVWITGEFMAHKITVGAGLHVDDIIEKARKMLIFITGTLPKPPLPLSSMILTLESGGILTTETDKTIMTEGINE